jgi:hypothetical protein
MQWWRPESISVAVPLLLEEDDVGLGPANGPKGGAAGPLTKEIKGR